MGKKLTFSGAVLIPLFTKIKEILSINRKNETFTVKTNYLKTHELQIHNKIFKKS